MSTSELLHFGVNLRTKTHTFQTIHFNHLTQVILAYTDYSRLLPICHIDMIW